MSSQERRNDGRFAAKSNDIRQVRSIRLTDRAWEKLGQLANTRSITRADLIEDLVETGILSEDVLANQDLNKTYVKEIKTLKSQLVKLENQLKAQSSVSQKSQPDTYSANNLGTIQYCTSSELFEALGVSEGQVAGWSRRKTLPKIIDREGKKYKIDKNNSKDKSKKAWYYQEVITIL